ncbi:MAG: apolipoprotein N-acyltransferase [Proteobacteria bacterium]|nr:apolipoprotein N-acyltransferase [Pseudomonadota bacterium]
MKYLKNSFILTAISAAVLAICFFPVPSLLKILIPYFIFVPVFYALDKSESTRDFFLIGFTFGLVLFIFLLYWMFLLKIEGVNISIIRLGVFLLVVFVALQYGIGFAIFGLIKRKYRTIWPFIIIFPLTEFWRGLGPSFGFQWGIIPLTQSQSPFFIQYADLIGVYGITFVILFVNYLIYKFLKTRKSGFVYSLAIVIVTIVLYGFLSINLNKGTSTVNVGIIQPNISPYIKHRPAYIAERFHRLEEMSSTIADSGLSLIVWPETASPVYLNYRTDIMKKLFEFVDSTGIPVLTGTPVVDFSEKGPMKYYNGAMMLYPGDSTKIYRKMLPVPFVERMPYADKFAFMKKIDLGEGDYSVGPEYTVFSDGEVKFSVIICFESMFENLSREFVKRGAQFLVNITEDAWFGKTFFSYMHTSFLPIRAIENRRTIVRCANTGISGKIDQWGRLEHGTEIFTKAALCVKIDVLNEKTFYNKYGFYFPEFLLLILLIYLFYPVFRRLYEGRKH